MCFLVRSRLADGFVDVFVDGFESVFVNVFMGGFESVFVNGFMDVFVDVSAMDVRGMPMRR